ncbi:MAG: class I SAM-dependent rRNA methyltransferase [Acutalibacteraceae bacterium]
MSERRFSKVFITEKSEKSVRAGHPWVYGEEIISKDGECVNGGIVDVLSKKGRYLGSGFYNGKSKITVRIISKNTNDRFDRSFFERRIKYALKYRKTVMGKDFDNCRLIFGEADQFPGLTVDRFGDVLVSQVLCLGTELRKDMIYELIVSALKDMGEKITCIYERNDSAIRLKEGLEEYKGFYGADYLENRDSTVTEITENGITYTVDFENGQKTGFFLDQKYNRSASARIAEGKTVLDCFTHTGAFALNCAKAGAKKVTAVDISPEAIEMTKRNAVKNGVENIEYVCADVFEFLTNAAQSGNRIFDYVILDPPAFTKSTATVKNAVRGYKEINMKAMKLLPRGGYLATCSCSHFMTDELFRKMLNDAAQDAGVSLRQIEARQQSPDHPILWNVPETNYLKFYIFQII